MQEREQFVLSILITLVISLWFLKTYLSVLTYTQTPKYLQDEQRIHNLYIQNMNLKEQLLYSESYTKIASVAASRGFVKAPLVPL